MGGGEFAAANPQAEFYLEREHNARWAALTGSSVGFVPTNLLVYIQCRLVGGYPETLVFYRKRAFDGDCALVRCSGALSIKPFESSRPAADAGLMQIEWSEGAVSSCGELCGKARKTTPLVRKFAEAQNGC